MHLDRAETGSDSDSPPLRQAARHLAAQGLNLLAILPARELPAAVIGQIQPQRFRDPSQLTLILIGNGGPTLWGAMTPRDHDREDPVDAYSIDCARAFADRILSPDDYEILYPGDTTPPLQQLGALAGWHHPSPLGIGINRRWGLWFAYRCLILTDRPLAQIRADYGPSPCAGCPQKTCIDHCPASALSGDFAVEFNSCAAYRLSPGSACADRCLARLGCPVAARERYSNAQIGYHYGHSLETLRRLADASRAPDGSGPGDR